MTVYWVLHVYIIFMYMYHVVKFACCVIQYKNSTAFSVSLRLKLTEKEVKIAILKYKLTLQWCVLYCCDSTKFFWHLFDILLIIMDSVWFVQSSNCAGVISFRAGVISFLLVACRWLSTPPPHSLHFDLPNHNMT